MSVIPRSYHHGGLRDALIAAAERLMLEQANWTFTLREVARAAGVSHNAPYNHFPDRRALLTAIATRGFDDLTAALRRDLSAVDPCDIVAGLRVAARAYVAFAIVHPSRFRLMFSAELTGHLDPVLVAASEGAFALLIELVARGVSAGQLRADPHMTHALTAWCLVHGLGTLALNGRVPTTKSNPDFVALTDALSATLIDGLRQ